MPLSRRQPLGRHFADTVLLAALRFLRLLLLPWPMSVRIRFGGWAGWAAGRVSKRRRLALNNLKRAFAGSGRTRRDLERILDDSHRDLGRSLVEFLMSPSIDAKYFETHVEVEGSERLDALTASGKGAVLLTGHIGNWEFLNLMAGVRGYPLAVLAKVQKLAKTDAWLNRLRTQRGAKVVLRGMDVRQVYRTLEGGGLAGILADQDGGSGGIYAPLFGRQSSYPRGVARFSYKTGAPALPVFAVRTSLDRHRIRIGDPVRPAAGEAEDAYEQRVVAEFSSQLEAMVRQYPSQWIWAHRRWKSSPDRDIAVLDDGRKGHTHQALAVAAQVADRRAGHPGCRETRTVPVAYRSSFARAVLTIFGILTRGRLWGGMRWLRWALTDASYGALSAVPADVVISCGSSTEAVNLILSRDCGARSCYIHKPQFGRRFFSAVLVPGHDRAAGSNVLQTRGALSFVNPGRMGELRERARAEARIPAGVRAAALLVGGPSKHAPWDPDALEKIFFALREFSREHKLYLLVTTSRRTDPAVESAVERLFVGEALCPVLVMPNRSNPRLAYEGILAAADLILVTADSVSMVSEAVSTGKPVGLVVPGRTSADGAGKFFRFMSDLEREGSVTPVSLENLNAFLTRGSVDPHTRQAGDAIALAADLLAR